MKREFKVGDKVRAIDNASRGQFVKGDIYEVSLVREDSIEVVADSNGGPNGWGSEYFVPVDTFNDLIDVAVKAYKDGAIDNLEITKGVCSGAGVRINGNRQFTNSRPMDGIDFIDSLYTETFVIESEEDINKIKWVVAEAKLSNGKDIPLDVLDGSLDPYYTFCLLKGATVTQKKGNK